jgi:hypothetical protein
MAMCSSRNEEVLAPTLSMLKRLGTDDRQIVEAYFKAPMHQVTFLPRRPYTRQLHQSFGNVALSGEILSLGTVHIAVGFVDLGSLAAGVACWEMGDAAGRAAARPRGPGPLRWVGYEVSAPCVAKALVVVEMVKQGSPEMEVLQVGGWDGGGGTASGD